MKPILITIGIIFYILFPLDLLPDMLGPLGRIDDILFALAGMYIIKKRSWEESTKQHNEGTSSKTSGQAKSAAKLSPYEVLQIKRDASLDEIERAYKVLLTKYHPDKVSHLGEELQTTAHRKTLEIKDAYETLLLQRKS
jgi:uncharacterized membrane protein YkvA (DUF1232 family)